MSKRDGYISDSNPVRKYYGSQNKITRELREIGENNIKSIYEGLIKKADNGDTQCAMFLVNKIVPDVKTGRFINAPLPDVNNIDDAQEATKLILRYCTTEVLTIDEADKLFNMIEIFRKIIDTKELIEDMTDIKTQFEELKEKMLSQ